MKVITEKRLRELIFKDLNCDLIMADEAIEACAELNPWQPIESAPKDRVILVYYPGVYKKLGYFNSVTGDWNIGYETCAAPTHWQELPEDPK